MEWLCKAKGAGRGGRDWRSEEIGGDWKGTTWDEVDYSGWLPVTTDMDDKGQSSEGQFKAGIVDCYWKRWLNNYIYKGQINGRRKKRQELELIDSY